MLRMVLALLFCQLSASGPVTLEAPARVTAGQPFAVSLKGAQGQTAYLYVLDNQASVRLQGSVQSVVQAGTTRFPEVRLTTQDDFEGAVRLVVVVVDGSRSTSAVSLPVQVGLGGPQASLKDHTVGVIGAELAWEDGVLSVVEPGAAARAGLEGGDRIVRVDGVPIQGLAPALRALRGPPGTRVALSVGRGSKVVDLTLDREARQEPPLEFAPIAYQASLSPFQVTLAVVDDAGAPLAGARVRLSLDPAFTHESVLVFTTATVLSDASGSPASELTAVTGEDGRATLWVRLYNPTTPFEARLTATASYRGNTSNPVSSNTFIVYRR